MLIKKRNLLPQIIILISALLIAVCFAWSVIVIGRYAENDCMSSIEETTEQVAQMFGYSVEQSRIQLGLFSDILAANASNPDELLQIYMEQFCDTQNFSAVCIHRKDGVGISWGDHPPHALDPSDFDAEAARVPYISDPIAVGDTRDRQYVRMAVPVVRDGETAAILYGYISFDIFPHFISSSYFEGRSQFYIVDGTTGDFLMDEYHRYDENGKEIPLLNLYDGSLSGRESRRGYRIEDMQYDIRSGGSGIYVFKSQRTGSWYYTYYMPMGINNWSMQMTIDEETAFANYYGVRDTVFLMIVCVVVLAGIILTVLICQHRSRRLSDAADLHKADYLNAVQSALITAHNNPDFVDRALKLVGREMEAESVLLLTFDQRVVREAYYWPGEDRSRAMALLGADIREVFPILSDALLSGESILCDEQMLEGTGGLPEVFSRFRIRNILLVPISDNSGILKGAIATLNLKDSGKSPELLECVTRDFFLAITNLENHNIIKKMGAVDYLTGTKNRNGFESESPGYEILRTDRLWCVYVDANGLHEINNTHGHKAGDLMLCTIADTMKKIFGAEYVYRLGGDEFVAFRTDSVHEEMMNCKYRLLDALDKKGYSASVGFSGGGRNENGVFDVEKIMGDAEAIMYKEKWKYYQEHGLSTERTYDTTPIEERKN